jgi:hypothetical protein
MGYRSAFSDPVPYQQEQSRADERFEAAQNAGIPDCVTTNAFGET